MFASPVPAAKSSTAVSSNARRLVKLAGAVPAGGLVVELPAKSAERHPVVVRRARHQPGEHERWVVVEPGTVALSVNEFGERCRSPRGSWSGSSVVQVISCACGAAGAARIAETTGAVVSGMYCAT